MNVIPHLVAWYPALSNFSEEQLIVGAVGLVVGLIAVRILFFFVDDIAKSAATNCKSALVLLVLEMIAFAVWYYQYNPAPPPPPAPKAWF